MTTPTLSNLFHHHPTTEEGEIALRAAIGAGRVLRKKFYEPRQVKSKGYRDIVTDADFAANRVARSLIERNFPAHNILSEEDPAPTDKSEYVWMIDPLDGTSNYARQFPIFGVSIALARRGQPIVGVVYDPMRQECFYAERSHGAFLNGAHIHASALDSFDNAIIGYELQRDPKLRARGLEMFRHFALQGTTARIGGAAALSLCYIGAGRLDTYMQLTLAPWDVAAGILIAREGGASVTHLDGKPATLKGGAYLAGAPKLFPKFFSQIQQMGLDE